MKKFNEYIEESRSKIPYGLEISKTGRLMVTREKYESFQDEDIKNGDYVIPIAFTRVINPKKIGIIDTKEKYIFTFDSGKKESMFVADFITLTKEEYNFIKNYVKPEKITMQYTFDEMLKLKKKRELNKYLKDNEINFNMFMNILHSKIDFYNSDIEKLFKDKNKWIETEDLSDRFIPELRKGNIPLQGELNTAFFAFLRRTKNNAAKNKIQKIVRELNNKNPEDWYDHILDY